MQLIKRSFQITALAFLAVPFSAYADSWSCSNDNLVREVHVERTTSAPVPCNVVYKKQTEGVEDQVLWSAENDDSYCSEKAQGLVAKLESNGWVCTETISDDSSDDGTDGETASSDDSSDDGTDGETASSDDSSDDGTDGETASGEE